MRPNHKLIAKEEEALRIAAEIVEKCHRGEASLAEKELLDAAHAEMAQISETSIFSKNGQKKTKSS